VLSFTRAEKRSYDLVHSHYWLSAQVAEVLRRSWSVPMVQMFHTLALVKAQALDDSVNGEGLVREVAEQSAVRIADRIVAASEIEQSELVGLYGADPSKIRVVPLGVDTRMFRPLRQTDAR